MCGIAGAFAWEQAPAGGTLAAMLQSMIPRGPDDQGQATIPVAGSAGAWLLGARRLAILDLSQAGHQPMRDDLTGNWVAHNGEIFNFRELREQLAADGCDFRSDCDTEVLLHGYRAWGCGLFEKLEGMFACAIWDERAQQMLLARDRHGIKPLYYFSGAGTFLFASELRALLATGLVPRRMDATGLDSLLKFGAVQEPLTMVHGVRMLSAGYVLRHQRDFFSTRAYVDLFARKEEPLVDSGEVSSLIGQALTRAVRLRLISDVPLGVFLSGGLDSAAIAATATEHTRKVRTFTVTFDEKDFAEGEAARDTAQALGTEHTELKLSQDSLLHGLPGALRAMDQPTIDGVNTFFVSQATKAAGVTVALSGLGGDELFAGYRSFQQVPQMERAEESIPLFARKIAGNLLAPWAATSPTRKLAAWLQGENGYGHPYFLSRMIFFPSRVAQLSQPDWLAQVDFAPCAEGAARLAQAATALDPVNRVSCCELSTYMRNTLLRDTDCMSMAHSLEVRVPFLDHRLTSLMLRIPGRQKVATGMNKPLLVKALGKALPSRIAHRPKCGFEFPWKNWLRGQLRDEVAQTLREPGPILGEAIHWGKVTRIWDEFLQDREHWSRPWLFYVLRKWTAQHLGS